MSQNNTPRQLERGGVSIFIVIFTALLITIVTTSFTQLMVRNQQQATNNDLSQSAYDAALAGVEDAKRLLVQLARCEKLGETCADTIRTKINNRTCDTLGKAGIATFIASGEVPVGDLALNQAYTCVKIQLDRPDIPGELDKPNKGSKTLRLRVKDDEKFNRIRVSWYTEEDLQKANKGMGLTRANATQPALDLSNGIPLYRNDNWGSTTPSVMRAQLIQFNREDDIKLSDFSSDGTDNAKTLFLYPSIVNTGIGDPSQHGFNSDTRLSPTSPNAPKLVICYQDNTYMCSVELDLPVPKGGDEEHREAYLQLSALYNATSYKVELLNGTTPVMFNNIEPLVDSTGRASDLFRRVQAGVSVSNLDLPVPQAALDVNGDVCKNFSVTNDSGDYQQECE